MEQFPVEQYAPYIFLGAFGFLFVLFAVLFLRKSRKRRREMFAEEAVSLPEGEERELATEGLEPVPAEAELPEEEREEAEAQAEAEDEAEAEAEAEAARREAEARAEVEVAPAVDPKLQEGLSKTHSSFMGKVARLFGKGTKIEEGLWQELEDALLTADVGARLSMSMIDDLREQAKAGKLDDGSAVRDALKGRMLSSVTKSDRADDPLAAEGTRRPRVILFVGVNGVGKTTTIGKLAQLLKNRGEDVVLAAGDTFRAAATEQLEIWGERTGCKVIRGETGKDPASVIFNAIQHAEQTGASTVLADTAGRLHTKTDLMEEIKKVKRAAGKARQGAPDEVWLVVDATTGQNAVRQAEEFNQALGVTGVILTKLDGTAKGGVVIAIAEGLSLPVIFVGVGEQADDLRPFDPRGFVETLFAA